MLGKGILSRNSEAGVLCLKLRCRFYAWQRDFKPEFGSKPVFYAWQRASSLNTERSRCFMLGKGFQAGIRIKAGV